jgi:hypothetical protein
MGHAVICIHPKAMKLEPANTIGQCRVISDQHCAFGTGHVLDGVKREDSRPLIANLTPFITGACGMRCVFDDSDSVALGKHIQRVKVEGSACVVHRNNGFCTRCNGRFNRVNAGHQGVTIDIDKHRCRA